LECRLHAEEADALVWDRVAQALRNPELLIKEYDKQLEADEDAKLQERLSQIDRELNKLKRKQDRNLDLYAEEEIDMPTLKKRQEMLRGQKASLEREKEALKRQLERNDTDVLSVSEFCRFISQGLDMVTFEEKRQILRLLNIEGRVKDGVITLTGCISDAESCGYSASHQPAIR
jgi:chromosome segregation ATPase